MKRTVRYVNQHLKPLAKAIGINEAISYQWARHTFNTLAVQSGASLEWVQQMQGHANIKTTMNYFQGFPEEQTKEIMESLTKF
jgi:site-specific recombinase XerD